MESIDYANILSTNPFHFDLNTSTVWALWVISFLKEINLSDVFPVGNIWLCASYILWHTQSKMQEFYFRNGERLLGCTVFIFLALQRL